ncbi:restriction endonuclease subunit S [Leisingera sp. MMG026]|uniref:restriction endonuclease subunit S n=1 Tax=Leisingera sp. MMG026 TaxID=2909982 RepID=UPI001EFFAF85|nr:restriction endonuclease subunit S [Leisingera sp. MMG026]MCF6431076.1 restriction endonuclease subunit S [Leisingera sp. MMG026]
MDGTVLSSPFKKSEVGFIPNNWNLENLASLVDPDRGIRYGIVQPGKFDPNGRFLIRGQDYSRGWVDSSEFFRVSDAVERRYRNARVATGDLIITIVGASTGEVAKVPAWLNGANLTQTTARVAIDEKRAHPDFVFHMLRSQVGATNVSSYVKGGAQPGLNCGDVERFLLPVPESRAEQEAIAEALSDADALIEGLERLIAKKRLIKQGAMQDLLTAMRRLPGFSGEWVETNLRKLLKSAPSYGINSAACALGSGGYDYLRITDINEHGQLRQDGRAEVLHPAAAHYFLEPDEIVVARTGASTGKSHRYTGPRERTVYAGFLIKLAPATIEIVSAYLFQFMQTDAYWTWIGENSARSGQPGINGQQLAGMTLVIPQDTDEQQAIADVLNDMDAEIQALETRLEKARQVKEGMMQNLLTGRIRLV